jgi:dipeptidase E
MKQLFLTSSVDSVAHDIAKRIDLSQNNKLVFIDTPAEPEQKDRQWLMDDRQSLVDVGFLVTDYTITGKTKNQLEEDLKDFDYIYISGGDTFYLLEKSRETNFITVIRDLILNKGKTYIGTSAGSIIAGEKCPDYLLDEKVHDITANKDGYALVNFTILPHWGSDHFREKYLDKRLSIAYRADQVPLLLLTDTQYVHVVDESMQIIKVR